MRTRDLRSAIAVMLIAAPAAVTAQTMDEHKIVSPEAIEWAPGPASIPPGAEAASLYGDPSKEGLFALRLKLPKGYSIPSHMHPKPRGRHGHLGNVPFGHGRNCRPEQGATPGCGQLLRPSSRHGALCPRR